MTIILCHYTDPPHEHEWPDDWLFGGANGLDPRADPRYEATTYTYYDEDLSVLWITQAPLCDDQALDEFTKIAGMGWNWKPTLVTAKRPDKTIEFLPWVYDKATDMITPRS